MIFPLYKHSKPTFVLTWPLSFPCHILLLLKHIWKVNLGCVRKSIVNTSGEVISPQHWWHKPWLLCPVLNFQCKRVMGKLGGAQQRATKMNKGIGSSPVRRSCESWDCWAWRWKAQTSDRSDVSNVCHIGETKKDWVRLFLAVSSERNGNNKHKRKYKTSFK